MLQENLQKVRNYWKKEKLNLAKPLLRFQLFRVFEVLTLQISKDVIEVYSTLNGFDENEMDSECLTFWTIEKILKENKPNSEFVYFADFLIDSHHYAFKFEDGIDSSIYIHYSEKDRPKVASSFAEFFELYLTNTGRLFL